MKQFARQIGLIVLELLAFPMGGADVRASDAIELAGDVLQFVLPATAAGLRSVVNNGHQRTYAANFFHRIGVQMQRETDSPTGPACAAVCKIPRYTRQSVLALKR
jgi:hypothetical protein